MKLYAPKYYREFICIADKCRHSCCVGWEIDVDSETYDKYKKLNGGYGEMIKQSIDTEDTPHFILCEGDRCPHLDEKGLCRIILNLGEDHLCDICREHPRFYNYTSIGKEVGLGISCEEACRIVLSSDSYKEIIPIGDASDFCEQPELINDTLDGFDAISCRNEIYAILSDRSLPYTHRLSRICDKFSVSLSILTDAQWQGVIESLEYLYECHADQFRRFSSSLSIDEGNEELLERALAYFIYRHCSEAFDMRELRASLGFCLFAERLLASLSQRTKDTAEIFEAARIISEELEYCEENTDKIKNEFDLYYHGEE
jgi:lysine-N-methylase